MVQRSGIYIRSRNSKRFVASTLSAIIPSKEIIDCDSAKCIRDDHTNDHQKKGHVKTKIIKAGCELIAPRETEAND